MSSSAARISDHPVNSGFRAATHSKKDEHLSTFSRESEARVSG
jgi:hypothetical protein